MHLTTLLQLAYSAERAAAFAYRGHAHATRNPVVKQQIKIIEAQEWEHREHALRMMNRLGIKPSRYLEVKFYLIGKFINASCHIIGTFMPLYFAGRLESGNVNEYISLLKLVEGTALSDEAECIQHMAVVEKEHELYFLAQIEAHWLLPIFSKVFRWGRHQSFNRLVIADKISNK